MKRLAAKVIEQPTRTTNPNAAAPLRINKIYVLDLLPWNRLAADLR